MAFEGRPAAFGLRVGRVRRPGPRARPRQGAPFANGALGREFEDRTRGTRVQRRGTARGLARGDRLPSPRESGRGAARVARGLFERRLKAVGERAHTGRIATREATGKGEADAG